MAKKKKPVMPEKVEPLYIKGRFHCPRCESRDHLDLADYDSVKDKPGLYWFKWVCSKCFVEFEVEEGL